jgi:hypothetical protein
VFKKLRTNTHYLTLIKAIAFWHQQQREMKQGADGKHFIEATQTPCTIAEKITGSIKYF